MPAARLLNRRALLPQSARRRTAIRLHRIRPKLFGPNEAPQDFVIQDPANTVQRSQDEP
jgi:hypothetical protein